MSKEYYDLSRSKYKRTTHWETLPENHKDQKYKLYMDKQEMTPEFTKDTTFLRVLAKRYHNEQVEFALKGLLSE